PRLIKSMPRSGSWLNSVKVVMGFLELAAAVKFLRGGELLLTGRGVYLSFDLALGIYVALCLACGLYLLNVYRLPHDYQAPETNGEPSVLEGQVRKAVRPVCPGPTPHGPRAGGRGAGARRRGGGATAY